MNTAKCLNRKFATLEQAESWVLGKQSAWTGKKITECKDGSGFSATVYNPHPVLCPYTGRAIGQTLQAK